MAKAKYNYKKTMDANGNVLTKKGQGGNTGRSMGAFIRERGMALAGNANVRQVTKGANGNVRTKVVAGTAKS